MAGNALNTPAQRIGATKGAILKHATVEEVLGITGNQHNMAKNTGATVKFRRWLPVGGAATDSTTINTWDVDSEDYQLQEGTTPESIGLSAEDRTVTMRKFGALFYYTDFVEDLYEDDVPKAQKEMLGELMGLIREMNRYGTLKGCTNKFYCGGSGRTTVDAKISLTVLRAVSRSLMANTGRMITQVLEASPKYGTTSVEPAYLVFVHTDAVNDIRNLEGFRHTSDYGTRKLVHEREIGTCEDFRFIVSPRLKPIIDSGAAVGSTGLKSTGSSNIDVYPFIMVAKDAWGDVALRGSKSFDYSHLKPGMKDKADPLGQRGYVGATFYAAPFVQNDGWMAVVEAGVTDLDVSAL